MTDLAELVASWIQAVRIASPGQWLLRSAVLLAGAAAVLACWMWFPSPPSFLALVLVLAVWAALWPGSWGPFLLSLAVVIWWLGGGGGAPWWQVALLALLLAVGHLAAAYAAAGPPWAVVSARAGARMARAGGVYLAACVALGLLVWVGALLVPGVLPGGVLWIAAGVAALGGSVVAVILTVRRRTRAARRAQSMV